MKRTGREEEEKGKKIEWKMKVRNRREGMEEGREIDEMGK